MREISRLKALLIVSSAAMIGFVGCTPKLDPRSARAESGAPDASDVPEIDIPYEPGIPKYVVAVQPLKFSVGSISGNTVIDGKPASIDIDYKTADSQAHVITAQLTSALSNIGNIVLLDDSGMSKAKSGRVSASLKKGEKGPYVVSGTITEFNEVAEADESSAGGSLGWAGAAMGIAGAIADKPGLMWTGAGLAAANPTYEESEASRKGMVAIDLKLTDGKTGRIIRAFSVKGTFKAVSASSGFSLFGIGKTERKFASSAIGQAMRVALNDAAEKTYENLKSRT